MVVTSTQESGDQWFIKGQTAFAQKEYSSALEYFAKAVEHCPENLEYRKQLHRSSRRRLKQSDRMSKVDAIRLAATRGRLRTAAARQNWADAERYAEECIAINPWDATLFVDLARAAAELDRYELARYAWTAALKLDRENGAYYREFGALLQDHGDYEMARSCYQSLGKLDPTGRIAGELLQSVEVAMLMNKGYSGAWNARDVERGKPSDRARVQNDETATGDFHSDQYIKLGDQHVRAGQLRMALDAFRRASELDPDSLPLQRRMEDIELAYLRQQALKARKAAQQQPDNERLRETANQKVNLVTSRELTVLTERVRQSPDDLSQVLRLADLYRRSNQLELAAPLFEQISSDPDLCVEALIGLGECWVKTDGRAEHGRMQLENALRLIDPDRKPACYKLAHYWLGRLCEKRNQFAQADRHYEKIVTIDGSFQDTATRRLALFQQQIEMENQDRGKASQ